MANASLAERTSVLEQRVASLEQLPAKVEAVEGQIVQLRQEMRSESSAIRQEIREGDEETRRFMRVLHEDVIARIATLQDALPRRRKKRPAGSP